MRVWLALVVGALAVIIGIVWTLQGVGYLAGSAMSGERVWAMIGPLVAATGLVSIVFGVRTPGR